MSKNQDPRTGSAHSVEKTDMRDRETESQDLRFTPLRSYVGQARALAKERRGEPELSRLVQVSRL